MPKSSMPVTTVTRRLSSFLLFVAVVALFTFTPGALLAAGRPIVALDIGHLPSSPGALSARGQGEYFFNKSMVEYLARVLQKRDRVEVVVLNPQGDAIALKDRGAEAAKHGASLLVSIHHDSVQPKYLSVWIYKGNEMRYSDKFSGYSIFYSEKNSEPKKSLAAAEFIGDEVRKAGLVPTPHHAEPIQGENRPFVDPFRGIYRYDDLIVLKSAPMPAVLVECGVIVNRFEERKILSRHHRKLLAESLANGIEKFMLMKVDDALLGEVVNK